MTANELLERLGADATFDQDLLSEEDKKLLKILFGKLKSLIQ